ncbi:MAG: ral nucleoside transport system permease protein [Actinomycetota bacterium]|nr:ral nucleoside transport system permease protein [Actinomycetota bacterium]
MSRSMDLAPSDALLDPSLRRQSKRRLTGLRMLYFATALLLVFSLVRLITGVANLTAAGTVAAALGLAVPIGMAGLGGLWSERAGVVNIGLEGMLVLGTFGAGWAGYQWGPWVGLMAAILFGALGGLLHAVATVTFAVDQIVSGVAINILAIGMTQFLAAEWFTGVPGGGQTQSPPLEPIGSVTLPGISSAAATVADQGWFFVSDLAGIVAGLTTDVSYITVIAIGLTIATFYILWRTAFGLRLRSCGEAPYAAATLGVNVIKYKYIAVITSGALAGVGGAFLAIVAAGIYREGQTGGRGYIGLAAMIFGNWRPGGLAVGAGLFGYTDALQLRGGGAVHALLLLTAILLIVYAGWLLYRRRLLGGAISMGVAAAVYYWYATTSDVPSQVAFVTPYVATLLVLALATQRLRMPAADGRPYLKGEEH